MHLLPVSTSAVVGLRAIGSGKSVVCSDAMGCAVELGARAVPSACLAVFLACHSVHFATRRLWPVHVHILYIAMRKLTDV